MTDEEVFIVGLAITCPWCADFARNMGVLKATDDERLNDVFIRWVYEPPPDQAITEEVLMSLPRTKHPLYVDLYGFIREHVGYDDHSRMRKFQRALRATSKRWAPTTIKWAHDRIAAGIEAKDAKSLKRAAMVLAFLSWEQGPGVWDFEHGLEVQRGQ